MVGEISPDGNFIWNGTEWLPHNNTPQEQNVFQLTTDVQEQEIGWEAVSEKLDEGSKGKMIAMSIVGLLVLTALSWVVYAFVIDPMLFPDELKRDEFIKMANDEPTIEDVISGEVDYWTCDIDLKLTQEEDGESITIRGDYSIYASEKSARVSSEMSALFTQFGNDIWMDENQIAWDINDEESGRIDIESLSTSPTAELLTNSDAPIEFCFIHQLVATGLENDASQPFSSEGERFPDEDGVRAVKIVTKQELEDDDIFTISVYFDGDGNLLGTKMTNSSSEILVEIGSDSFSKPSWVKNADSDTPMPVIIDSDIWSSNHSSTVETLFNSSYSMEGAKVVLYTEEYDYENDIEDIDIAFEVDIDTAINEGGLIQSSNEWYGENNCTLSYTDNAPIGEISTGDVLSISCDNYAMSDYQIGISNENGIASEVDLSVPWVSPFFTIIALLGAALLVSRRE